MQEKSNNSIKQVGTYIKIKVVRKSTIAGMIEITMFPKSK